MQTATTKIAKGFSKALKYSPTGGFLNLTFLWQEGHSLTAANPLTNPPWIGAWQCGQGSEGLRLFIVFNLTYGLERWGGIDVADTTAIYRKQ